MKFGDKHCICILLILLNLCFIWGNSLLPAAQSQELSDWVMELLPEFTNEEVADEDESTLLRKIAHFAEFTVLGLLLSWLFRMLRKHPWYPLPWGVVAAFIDETIQYFVPGRGPGILDVGIDTCGVLMGMLLLQIGYFLMKQKQSKQDGGNE